MDKLGPTGSKQPPPAVESRPRVLVVDDRRESLHLLQAVLRSAGIECFACRDGQSALDFLTDRAVDVILLDVMMPQIDGYEVCRRIKSDERTRDIPILFLAAKLETEDKLKGFAVGGHDYLSKPINHQELLARTHAALRVKQLQDQLKEQIQLQQRINQLHQGMLSEHWQKLSGNWRQARLTRLTIPSLPLSEMCRSWPCRGISRAKPGNDCK